MNAKIVLVFIGVIFVVVNSQTIDPSTNVSEGPQKCRENEEWQECGSTCPPSCGRRFPPRIVCVQVCNPSCQCSKGFLRNFDGKCVRPQECRRIPFPIEPQPPQLPTPAETS